MGSYALPQDGSGSLYWCLPSVWGFCLVGLAFVVIFLFSSFEEKSVTGALTQHKNLIDSQG